MFDGLKETSFFQLPSRSGQVAINKNLQAGTGHNRLNHYLFTKYGVYQSEMCLCQAVWLQNICFRRVLRHNTTTSGVSSGQSVETTWWRGSFSEACRTCIARRQPLHRKLECPFECLTRRTTRNNVLFHWCSVSESAYNHKFSDQCSFYTILSWIWISQTLESIR